MPDKYQHQRAVSDGPDDEYDSEQYGNDVCLGSAGVVVVAYRRQSAVAAIGDEATTDVSRDHDVATPADRAYTWTPGCERSKRGERGRAKRHATVFTCAIINNYKYLISNKWL